MENIIFLNGRGLLGVLLGGFRLRNLDYWNTDSEIIYVLCLIDLAARILGGDWEQFLLVFFLFFDNDKINFLVTAAQCCCCYV